ncbi:MAG TPA: FAD-dependent oxidoreductase [Planctomycetota bacterium]|nr:FAD-dependent oxidoreductase [Planctomycetota bacterium]
MAPASFEAVVVGGGVHGLAAAFHLQRLGVRRLLVLERFALGHSRGSSHGRSRITRSAYREPIYAELVRLARAEEWPRLERAFGRPLVADRDGCFFGPRDGPIEAFAVPGVEPLDLDGARRRFPQIRFTESDRVLLDATAGVVAAAETVAGLARSIRAAGGEIRENAEVRSIDVSRDPVEIDVAGTRIEAERAVVAAGPWTSRLLPWLRPRLTPLRQTVGYFEVEGAERFPTWAWYAADAFFYGLPDLPRPLLKAAPHVVSGSADDPEEIAEPSRERLGSVRAFLDERLVSPARLVEAETCFYTATANEDYVLDVHPDNPRVAIGAGFSGHGFKLAPLSGRILAELALWGRTTVAPFERERARFAAR